MSKPVFEDIFTFQGRRDRKSFALYSVAQIAAMAVLLVPLSVAQASGSQAAVLALLPVTAAPLAALCISGCAVAAQRSRDCGLSGWATLIAFLPVLGWIFALALFVIPGYPGANSYGPDPLDDWRPRGYGLAVPGKAG